MVIKENGWRSVCAIKEHRIVSEAWNISEEKITSSIDRFQEFTVGYRSKSIWSMHMCASFSLRFRFSRK